MTVAERRRLVGVLSRLASDHDGERAAAGLLASRMLRSAGLTWDQVIPSDRESSQLENSTPANPWRSDLALCRRHPSFLRQWEQDFVMSLSSRRTISPKQQAILFDLAAKLRAGGKA